MSRHRDVRNMDYSDDYDGYDDIYGHSVDDDYYISPSHRQFMYNRENTGQSRSGEVFPMEQDIQEEDESVEELKLSDMDRKRMESCLDHVKSTLAPLDMSRQDIVKIIIENKFESDKILNAILISKSAKPFERRDKDDTNLSCGVLNIKQTQSNFLGKSSKEIPLSSNHIAKQSIFFDNDAHVVKPQSDSTGSVGFNGVSNAENVESDTVDAGSPLMGSSQFNNFRNLKVDISPSVTFLSKIKKTDPSNSHLYQNQIRSNCSNNPFVSKLRTLHGEIGSNKTSLLSFSNKFENMTTVNPVGVSFLSKIKKPPNLELDSEGSSVDSTSADHSPQLSFLSKIKNLNAPTEIEPDNTVEDFSKKFSRHLTLQRTSESNENSSVVNNFLNKININTVSSSQELNNRGIKLVDVHSGGVAQDMSQLKVTEVKSLPTFRENIERNGFKIDLTKALRKNNSEILKSKIKSSADAFEIPFLACDDDSHSKDINERILKCTLDISNIASRKFLFVKKKPSCLGRIMCMRYKIPLFKKCKKKKLKLDPHLKRFDFSTPSPDDKINQHLRRDF